MLCHSEHSLLSFRASVRNPAHGRFAPFSMTRPKMSFRASARNPAHGCFASLSMTNWWMLHFVQHDRPMSFRTLSFVIPNASEESTHGCFTALRFVQHDRPDAIPSTFSPSFQMFFPCYSEYFFLSFQAPARNPARCGCFALLSMAGSGMATSCPSPCKRRGTSAHGRQGEVKLTFVPTPRIRLSCR